MTKLDTKLAIEHRCVVSWTGQSAPIVLALYSPAGEVAAVKLSPTRALELAKNLTEPAVIAINANQWGPGWQG